MPRLIFTPPAYKLHKRSGRARVRFQGKEYWLPGLYGSTESMEAYAQLIPKLMGKERPAGDPAAPEPTAPSLLSIAELIEKYWKFSRVYYRRPGGRGGEHETIRAALRPLLRMFGRTLAVQFKPRHLKLVREEMIRLDWSRRYINASVGRIKRFFNWAVEEEYLPPEVAGALVRVKGLKKDRTEAREKPRVVAVSDATIKATLPFVSPLMADLIGFMRLTGCRPGEARGMTAESIDRSDPQCWTYRPAQHKNAYRDKPRTVYIGPRAQAIVASRMLKAGSGRVFPITESGAWDAINNACKKAKIPRWTLNMLRHAAATEIRKKFGAEGAQVILGHSQLQTTEIYAEINEDRGREVARLVG